jgi:hypothetical protein
VRRDGQADPARGAGDKKRFAGESAHALESVKICRCRAD